MEFRILGPLEARDEGRALSLGGAKQRALLAVLLLHANEVVSTDRLIDELWGDEPPEKAQNALHVYVSQLRKVLEAEHAAGTAGRMLVTQSPGYLLRVEPEQLDLRRFERLREEARTSLAEGDVARASAKLRDALGLWRGTPLADLAYERFAQAETARLEELRLSALEERIEADLALGLHADLVAELEPLVARYPLRERLRGQLMLALYRSGRQAEALEAYKETRRVLVEELGIEPSPALQRLERAILLQDPSLEPEPTAWQRSEELGLEAAQPPAPSVPLRRPRPWAVIVAVAGMAAFAAAISAFVLVRGGESRLEAVGVVEPNSLLQIDPGTNRVVEAVAVGTGPTLVASGESALWVANFDDRTLSRIDPESGEEVKRIAAGGAPTGLAAGAGAVWITHSFDGTMSRLDPGLNDIVATLELGNGVGDVAVGEDAVWVANRLEGTVLRIDPRTNDVVATIEVGGTPDGIAAGAGAVWVANGRAVLRLSPATNEVEARIALRYTATRVAVGERAVWVTNNLGDAVTRIDLAAGSAAGATPVGDGPTGVAVGAGAVWVVNSLEGTVSRIDPATGKVVGTIQIGHAPEAVAIEAGKPWVSVASRS